MGIVLKRRDNAPIVKTIYGGVIDIILNKRNVEDSKKYFKKSIKDLLEGVGRTKSFSEESLEYVERGFEEDSLEKYIEYKPGYYYQNGVPVLIIKDKNNSCGKRKPLGMVKATYGKRVC